MNVQELRIGNLICTGKKEDGTDEIGIVVRLESTVYKEWNTPGEDQLSYLPLDARHETDFWETDEYSPIPLTKEWLLRFGFKKSGSDDGTEKWLLMEKSSESYTGEICLLSVSWHCYKNFFFYQSLNHKIYHVHQLQNLVNVLTGKELILKPEKETA